MKIAVCEADALFRAQLEEVIADYSRQNVHQGIVLSVFDNAEELLEDVQRLNGFDLYLLDIVMPGMNGIALGRRLRHDGDNGTIIYLSANTEYAFHAYSVQAFNYLVRPLSNEALRDALDQAVRALVPRLEKSVIVKTAENSTRLSFDSILYAELDRRSIVYHLTNQQTVESRQIRTPFSVAVEPLVQDSRFVLCGASVAANMHQIAQVEKDMLVFKDGSRVYIPRKVCTEVRSVWTDFWKQP